jgi:protein TonB
MIITVDSAGRIVETEIVQASQSKLLDKRAISIVQAAAPFGSFSPAMKKQADQLVIPTRFRFSREEGFETSVAGPTQKTQ